MSESGDFDTYQELLGREQRAKQEMSALALFGQSIHNPTDKEQLYAEFFKTAARIMTVDAGYMGMLLPDGSHLRTVYQIDKGIVYNQPEPWLYNKHGPINAVVNHDQIVIMQDLQTDTEIMFPLVRSEAETFGDEDDFSHAWMMVPIRTDQHVIGITNVQSYQKAVYGEKEAQLLITLSSMLAMGLAQIELVERLTVVKNALSVPLIPLSERVIFLPLLGQMDRDRIGLIQDLLLHTVQGSRIRYVVLSFLAVHTMQTEHIHNIERMIRALKLLGAETIVAGIPTALSLQFIQAGINLDNIKIVPNLQYLIETMNIL